MKVKTLNALQDAIDHEMSWRRNELTAIKSNIKTSRYFAKDTAIRAGIALLYAHWEGAIKNIATYYLEYVSGQKLKYEELKPNFLALAIKNSIKTFTESNKYTLNTTIVSNIINMQANTSIIPTNGVVKTNSNLNSNIFSEIMATLGLDCSEYQIYFKLIDEVLLKKRNKIAHGERLEDISMDEKRYDELYDKICKLITKFSIQISNAASQKLYLK